MASFSVRQQLKDILFITGHKARQLPLVVTLYLISIIVELIGLSIILPYLAAIQAPQKLSKFHFWDQFTSTFGATSHQELVLLLSAAVVLIFSTKALLGIIIQNFILKFSFQLTADLRARLARAYMQAPYVFHTKRRSSEIINTMNSHTGVFARGVVGSLLKIIGELTTVLVIGLFLIIKYPVPSLVSLSLIILFIWTLLFKVKKRLRQYGAELIQINNILVKTTVQGVQAIKEAQVYGNTEYFERAIADGAQDAAKVSIKLGFLQLLPRYVLELFLVTSIVITVVLNAIFFGDNENTINSLLVFGAASLRLLPAANQIATNTSSLFSSAPVMGELISDIKLSKKTVGAEPVENLTRLRMLELKNLSFRYPAMEHNILNGINMFIKKGEIIGIFGPSGSGKTTLANILLGLLDQYDGDILVNTKKIDKSAWLNSRMSAYVPQTPTIIDDEILTNVAFGEQLERIDRERVLEALNKAQLRAFIKTLRQGVKTNTGENAALISGGQKQRLAIARSFYFKRDLILLDEVTSSLDPEVEKDVLKSIQSLREWSAVVIISHSAEAKNICDRVYYLQNGSLVEQ